jgi:hypothetical protein
MMTYRHAEEGHARELHRALSEALKRSATDTELSLTGFGVHWNCTAKRGERSCSVACFESQGPEFLVSFEDDARTDATGRTASRAQVVAAVGDWLDGAGIGDLHTRFAFVDRRKRALTRIAAEVVEFHPQLGQSVSSEIRPIIGDLFALWLKASDRSCRIDYYGKNQVPDAAFHWDECELLRIRTNDTARLAGMLKLWLCDRAMPSAMAADFPDAEVKPVAQYYEDGRPVEGEFITSWDEIEHFYDDACFPDSAQVLGLIARIRQAGYDRTLRAGQSLWTLVVSRSRRHGLRKGQPCVTVVFTEKGMDVYSDGDGREKLSFPCIAFSPGLDDVLKRLTAKEID